jgi:hypothetical protein
MFADWPAVMPVVDEDDDPEEEEDDTDDLTVSIWLLMSGNAP